MRARIALATLIAASALSTPAFADFWIVRQGPAHQCQVMTTKPTDTKIIVGNTVYHTRDEATKEMATVCK